ncbi:hypothetical protein MKW98_016638 [Papaver atlanticum]|uniref:Uncharacterized protein n=1 Tax=Papaver atlanticum TaxID=357466 RepID=A0AAD4SSL1_9MAGN|nr:hypothetical protein MKW98_016638 [Papaver atlanticum]
MDLLNQAFELVRKNDLVKLGKEHGKDVEESGANIEPLAVDEFCGEPDQLIGNPIKIQTKGRKSDKEKEIVGGNSRCKSGIEMKRNPRKCKTCGGENHDRLNCPKKKAEQSSPQNNFS